MFVLSAMCCCLFVLVWLVFTHLLVVCLLVLDVFVLVFVCVNYVPMDRLFLSVCFKCDMCLLLLVFGNFPRNMFVCFKCVCLLLLVCVCLFLFPMCWCFVCLFYVCLVFVVVCVCCSLVVLLCYCFWCLFVSVWEITTCVVCLFVCCMRV